MLRTNSKAILTFFISSAIASCQRVLPISWSILLAPFTSLGTSIPNLWVHSQYLVSTFDLIDFLFFSTKGNHHANAGSYCRLLLVAYSIKSVAVFQIFQSHPITRSIFLPNQQVLTFGGALSPSGTLARGIGAFTFWYYII